jgi:hypothetical protein
MLIAVQSVFSIANNHIDIDGHSEFTTLSIQPSVDTLQDTTQPPSENEDLHEVDCHHGHCHHASAVYLAFKSHNLIAESTNSKVSQIALTFNSPLITPDLRPPIV